MDGTQHLMEIFKFDSADLEANRRGEITEAQVARLKRVRNNVTNLRATVITFFFFVAAFLLLGSCLLFFAISGSGMQRMFADSPGAVLLLGIILGASLALLALLVIFARRRVRGDYITTKTVKPVVATGEAVLSGQTILAEGDLYGNPPGVYHVLDVSGVKLQIPEEQHSEIFRPGITYRVYFVQSTPGQTILSVEALG